MAPLRQASHRHFSPILSPHFPTHSLAISGRANEDRANLPSQASQHRQTVEQHIGRPPRCLQPADDQDPDPREDQPDDAVPDDDAQRRTVVEEPSRDDVEGPFTRTKPSTDRRRDPPQRQ
jgi:hypothetical protein